MAGYAGNPYLQPAYTYASGKSSPVISQSQWSENLPVNNPTPSGSSIPKAPQAAPQPANNTPSQPTVDNAAIDAAYSGETNFLNGLGPQLQDTFNQGQDAANSQYSGEQKNIGNQLGQLNSQLGIDRNNFGHQMNSAYSDAQNMYNQLLQRNLSMYGGGSSAGPAMAAILGQGYQQQTGQLQGQDLQGNQQLDLQQGNISQWGDQQNNQLDLWHNQALQQLKQQFNDGMNAINLDRTNTEQAKSLAKLGLLQNIVNQQNSLTDYKNKLQAYTQAYASASPQNMNISQFDPGNYAGNMANVGSGVGQALDQFQQQYSAPQQQGKQVSYNFGFLPGLGNKNNDQLTA